MTICAGALSFFVILCQYFSGQRLTSLVCDALFSAGLALWVGELEYGVVHQKLLNHVNDEMTFITVLRSSASQTATG